MTLVFAGYNYSKSIEFTCFSDDAPPYIPEMEICGLFMIADSAITASQGDRTLLGGFRKVYELEAKLWKPYFMSDGSFRNYLDVFESRKYIIGFAGSTLTAQHIINSITEHLGKLRISYSRKDSFSPIKYEVIRHCQRNPLTFSGASYWDDDTFLDNDFVGLLTGEVIADFVEYSINNALHSASSYKLSMREFQSMHTDIVFGVWCPYKKRHELYLFRMLRKTDDNDIPLAYTKKELLKEDEVAVLGMRDRFESNANTRFRQALENFNPPAEIMYQFLGECIDEVQNNGSKEIDRPISFRKLNENKINRIN